MRCLVLIAVVLIAPPAWANPVDLFGLGARGPAMGGAQTAAANDSSAGYYNPALLSTLDNLRIDIGYQYADMDLKINDKDLGVDSSRGFALGLVAPGQIGPVRVALGGAFFLPDRYLARTRALEGTKPRFQVYDNRPQRFLLSANLSVMIGERLAFGGGISYMSATDGLVELEGRVGFPDETDSDLALGIDMDVQSVQYPQAGVWFRALPWLSVGASYRGEFTLHLNQIVDIRGDVGASGLEPVVEDGFFNVQAIAQDLFQPMQLTVGAEAVIGADLRLSFDLGWHRWSAFNNPATELILDLDVGDFNDEINIPEREPFPEPNFDDVFVPRLGAEYTAYRSERVIWDARGGYSFEKSPAPLQTGETNFVDNDKHTISLGSGVTLSGLTELLPLPFSLDIYGAITVLPERMHQKVDVVDPIGDYRSDGLVYQVGAGSRWRF